MHIKKFIIAGMMLAAAGMAFAKTKIVTTIFPEYDWVREIAGDKAKNAEITLLIDSGIDLHSYQPSIKDIAKISTADIFIYVGGESDAWVNDVLKNAKKKDMKVINLMEVLGDKVKVEEIVEGMQVEEEEEHEHEHENEHEHGEEHGHHHHASGEEEAEYDEHVWLSVRNAKILCGAICDALCQKDAKNASAYRANLAAYTAKLDRLDADFAVAVRGREYKDTALR